MMHRTSVLLADDHLMFIEGLAKILRHEFDIAGLARDGREMVDIARHSRPDVVVTDISTPRLNGIDAGRLLLKEISSVKLIFLSMYADYPMVEQALRAGGSGYLIKTCSAEEFIKAIRCVAGGASYITPQVAGGMVSTLLTAGSKETGDKHKLTIRHREVLQLLAEGKTAKEIASTLHI